MHQSVFIIVIILLTMSIFTGDAQQQSTPAESKTVCKITSGDVEATAEATISRNIDGVCTTEELQRELRALEIKLMQELINIKGMLAQQFNLGLNFQVPLPADYVNSLTPLVTTTTTPPPFPPPNAAVSDSMNENDPILFPNAVEEISQKIVKRPEMKSLVGPRTSNTLLRSRDSEIHTFNNTILKAGDAKIFTYFWKLENFSTFLNREEFEISSPVFSIENISLRAIGTFNYMQRDFFNIRIEEVSEDFLKAHHQKKYSSIKVETTDNLSGGIFQRIEIKKQFKHKIIIMDHGTPATDLISQDFYDTNNGAGGFSIPTSAIQSERYAKNDTVLIRIVIYI